MLWILGDDFLGFLPELVGLGDIFDLVEVDGEGAVAGDASEFFAVFIEEEKEGVGIGT